MVKTLLSLLFLGFMYSAHSQESKVYFDGALTSHLKKYNEACDIAIQYQNFELAEVLFDSLLKNHLKNTYVPNLKLNKLSGRNLNTNELDNPFIIITQMSWLLQTDEEIEAINDLASHYKGKLDVIVLFWDTKQSAKSVAKNYNKDVIITYIDESKNRSNNIIRMFKHSFGISTCFFISNSKQIVSIAKGFKMSKDCTNVDVVQNTTHNTITRMLIENQAPKSGIITTIN